MRRVVTGYDQDGKSVVVIDDQAQRVTKLPNLPGYSASEIWTTERDPQLPLSDRDPTLEMDHFIADLGETRFTIITMPPDAAVAELAQSGQIDVDQAWVEFGEAFPDMSQTLEPDHPGMHTTDSIDYVIVLSGETWCELDAGVEVHLRPGDCLVQCGTRHKWHYRGSEPCVVACIMVGARRG